jgi:hypothetical protein
LYFPTGRHCLREKAKPEPDEPVRVAWKRYVARERAEVRLTPACATMASIGKAQAPLLASNDAQNGELGERERGSDYMAKAPKLNSFGHGPPDGWSSFGRFRENGRARPAD